MKILLNQGLTKNQISNLRFEVCFKILFFLAFNLRSKGAITDEDKEKLSKIMAYGKDANNWPKIKSAPEYDECDYESEPEKDRFDECNNLFSL